MIASRMWRSQCRVEWHPHDVTDISNCNSVSVGAYPNHGVLDDSMKSAHSTESEVRIADNGLASPRREPPSSYFVLSFSISHSLPTTVPTVYYATHT